MIKIRWIQILLFIILTWTGAEVNLPIGFTHEAVVEEGLNPTVMEFAKDGRLFIAEKHGEVKLWENGVMDLKTVLKLDPLPDQRTENGLLGMVLHPQFLDNGYLYLYYKATTPKIHNRLVRYIIGKDNKVVSGSELVLQEFPENSAIMHNGGALLFGKDDKLYVTIGDGAKPHNVQSLNSFYGKVLRLEDDGSVAEGNPFSEQTKGPMKGIWSLGFRNPFSSALDPRTGRIFVFDVVNLSEEITEIIKGGNGGWPEVEGGDEFPSIEIGIYEPPLLHMNRSRGEILSSECITGGAFYPSSAKQFPAKYHNKLFFGDYERRWIKVIDIETGKAEKFLEGPDNLDPRPIDIDIAPDGSMYYLSRGQREFNSNEFATRSETGKVFRIQFPEGIVSNNALSHTLAGIENTRVVKKVFLDGFCKPCAKKNRTCLI